MGFRFEFDPANKILMTRMEGELTDDLVREADVGIRKHLSERNPLIHIVACSSGTKFSMSAESVRYLARREPVLQGVSCRRFFVMPSTVGFALATMFQIAGDPHDVSVSIVRSLEVKPMLNVGPFQFEVLE